MATRLREAATRAKDLYFQDYAPRDKFIDIGDFQFQIAVIYSQMLDALFQAMRRDNRREEGFSNIENSSAWLVEEILPIKFNEELGKYYVKTSTNIFSFNFDGTGNSLQGVCGLKDKTHRFRKISLNERRFLDVVPVISKVYYYLNNGNEIVFRGDVKEDEKITVQYIPQVVGNDDDCLLSDSIVAEVIKQTLIVMFGAKNGNVIDESNDGNKNAVLQQQTNPQLNKIQAS